MALAGALVALPAAALVAAVLPAAAADWLATTAGLLLAGAVLAAGALLPAGDLAELADPVAPGVWDARAGDDEAAAPPLSDPHAARTATRARPRDRAAGAPS